MTRKYLVTGGAGFIGSNYVHRLIQRNEHVTIFDNLSRAGAPRELGWEPKIDLEEGIELLFNWVKENRELF